MPNAFLPYGRQVIEDDDVAEVVRVLRSEMLTTGPEVPLFEEAFARATGARHAVACSNGTAALHLASLAIGISPGDTAIVPSITFLATANAVILSGGQVIFSDVDPETGLMTAEHAAAAVARAQGPVKLISPVHLGGQTCDTAALKSLADHLGASIVEDSCHAAGTMQSIDGVSLPIGSCARSDMAVFSFHPVKTITAAEGGVVTTQSDELAKRLHRLRNHGMTREPAEFTVRNLAFDASGTTNPWYYEMPEVGLNYRLTDIQAALARNQLSKLPRFAQARRQIAELYDELLEPLAPRVKPVAKVAGCTPVLHLYQVLVDFPAIGMSRAELMAGLRKRGIGTQVHYIPVHLQPYYRALPTHADLPGADSFYARTLSLPLSADMSSADAERVVSALRDAMRAS
jgi:UDP-4-amino-4,6-dideoxy-N-acetyl-beta-L-altrosamine transaminase